MQQIYNKNEQKLTFYPFMTLGDIDWKIREIGKQWKRLYNIEISYVGGAYMVTMVASEINER